jgi:hypothetical protein
MFRKLFYWAGIISVAPISFAVTVLIGDAYGSRPKALAEEKALLIGALRDYKSARGAYPILPDRPISDLKAELVRTGYIRADDRPEPDKDARYVSLDGRSFGFLYHVERTTAAPLGKPCLIEVDTTGPTGWWGPPQNCSF